MKLVHTSGDAPAAARWSAHFELISDASVELGEDELHLRLSDGQLRLHRGHDRRGVGVDPLEIAGRRRGDFALSRACGRHAAAGQLVVDATAGLGTDALALCARGYRVVLVEREPALWALLDSHLRLTESMDVSLILGDAREILPRTDTPWRGAPAVVYIDTMFPDSGKSALPGKRMQYLRRLLEGAADDAQELVDVARRLATDRVVVKRRARDPAVRPPDWHVAASSIRYDVYRGSPANPPATPPA